jgi:hypothetical protein
MKDLGRERKKQSREHQGHSRLCGSTEDQLLVATRGVDLQVPGADGRRARNAGSDLQQRRGAVGDSQEQLVAASAAIMVTGTVQFSGFNVTVDSFDSSNTNYSTGGLYDATKALANGDVVTSSSVSNAIYIGDSKVYGSVHTGPGGIVGVDTGNHPGDSVGDSAWVNGGNIGIESGHALQDGGFIPTDVTLPNVTWMPPTTYKQKINNVMYQYKLDNSSPWTLSTLSSSIYISSPNTVLYVSSSLSMGSGTQIYIAPGASLTMYVGAASASIGGQGVINSTGLARDFTYYGLPSNTSVGIQANASFTGQIYAPEAYVTVGGGGSSPYDFSGQIISQSMKMNGHFNVHYDQNLPPVSVPGGYAAASWNEL